MAAMTGLEMSDSARDINRRPMNSPLQLIVGKEETKIGKDEQDWRAGNMDYLLCAIAMIRNLLYNYIGTPEGQECDSLEHSLEKLQKIQNKMPGSPALNTISEIFNLSQFEQAILLCCTGQAIDPEFPHLLAIAHNKSDWNYPTFQLACQCFPQPHWDALTEHRPLRRWQLIHYAPTPELPRACLHIDEAILHYLMGETYSDPALTLLLSPGERLVLDQNFLSSSHQTIVDQIIGLLDNDSSILPMIQLCGTMRASQRDIAIHVSHRLNWHLYCLPGDALPKTREDLQPFVMRWQRWFTLSPALLLIEVNEIENNHSGLLDPFLSLIKVPVLVGTHDRLRLSHPVIVTFDVATLEYTEQLKLWQKACQDYPDHLGDYLPRLAAQFRLSAAMIETASKAVSIESNLTSEEVGDRLWDFCRLQARPHLEELAQRIEVKTSWDDFILPQKEKNILRQILIHVRQQAKVYQNWGFASKNPRGLGLSVLFAGTSGTGKTTAAEVLAQELKLDLFRIDLSAVMSKYIGETEKNLSRIFDAAEKGGGILLFDEADALFSKRTEVKDSHDRHGNIEVSYLLQRMEAYQGLAILTTNLKDNIDRAFIRRLRFIVNFPYPKAPERSQIWERIFPSQTPTEGLNFKKLGQLDVTGGNIKSIALNAAFLAADEKEPVKMKHILEAATNEYLKWGRSLTREETQGWDLS